MTIGASPIASRPIASTSAMVEALPPLTVFVNGVDLTENVFIGADGSQALSVSQIITGTTTCELQLISKDGPDLDVEVGYEVLIDTPIGRIFGGTIEDLRFDNPQQSKVVNYELGLVDHTQCLNRRLVAASFEDLGDPVTQTIGDVFKGIHALVLADGCVVLGQIDDGPLLQKINFNFVTATQAFNDLQRLTGNTFVWRVDYFRVLTFRPRDSFVAPYDLLGADELTMQTFDFEQSRETYRNKQFVRGGKTTSDSRTDNFEADGKNKTFVCSLPLAGKPVIQINTVAVDPAVIGIKGVDDEDLSFIWFFAVDDPDVSARSAPVVGTDVDITYDGLFPIIFVKSELGEIAAREAIEPGDGIYENLFVDENLDLPQARATADGLIEKYARIPKRITYLTKKIGLLQAGMIQSVEFDRFGTRVIADYLLDTVELRIVGDLLEFSVKGTEGKEYLEWLEFWRQIISGRVFLLRDNEKIIIPQAIFDVLQLSEVLVTALSDTRIPFGSDPYTTPIFNSGKGIGKRIFVIEPGAPRAEADGPHLGPPLGA